MIIAVEGCAHGELDRIYQSVEYLAKQRNVRVDLLICCGDFQAVRNESDLMCMAVPQKFKDICSFYRYYSGELTAPILTIFIGGNHEASNYLQELSYGGWVAPNIYYLGNAGVVTIGGIRIAGLSGIFKGRDYLKGHYEISPYSGDTMRSVYHVRNLESFRLKQLKENIDVFLSHDWPRGVYNYADTTELLRWKPFFRDEIAQNSLGSQVGETLLHDLKPKHWFSAHLHCRFSATIHHNETQSTQFLALDKCLPKRKYLEIIEIPHDPNQSLELSYDPQWLAILRSTNHLLNVRPTTSYMPGPGAPNADRWDFFPTEEELESVTKIFNNDFKIPLNFTPTAEPFKPRPHYLRGAVQPKQQINPQTSQLCEKLGIDDPVALLIGKPVILAAPVVNPDEIDLDDVEDDDADEEKDNEPKVDSNDLFFVDTKPQRSKLCLPQPVSEKEDAAVIEASPDAPIPTDSDAVPKEENTAEGDQPVVKKFRRRNQEIYADQDASE